MFSRTIDKQIETEIEKTVDRVTNSAIQNSEAFDEIIDQGTSSIVDRKTVKISSATLRKAQIARKQIEKELASLENADLQIERAIKQSESRSIAKLISQLSSASEEARIKASDQLSLMGDRLSKSQVNEIIKTMRHGQAKWSKFLYRQSHCRWFEDTSVKYYAGRALENMKSKHVSGAIRREARNAKNKGKIRRRVTDHGWI